MKGIIRSLMAWWQSKRSDPLPPICMPVRASPTVTATHPTGPTLTGAPSPDVLASRPLLLVGVTIPVLRRRKSRVVLGTYASRWRDLEEGMSMLPAAMLLANYYDDGNGADAGSFGA